MEVAPGEVDSYERVARGGEAGAPPAEARGGVARVVLRVEVGVVVRLEGLEGGPRGVAHA